MILPTTPVVDMCATIYDADCWESYLRGFASHVPGYLVSFGPRFAAMTGLDRDALTAEARSDPHSAVDSLMATGKLGTDFAAHASNLARDKVSHQVVVGGQTPVPGSVGTVNDRLAALAAPWPTQFTVWAGLSLRDEAAALDELRHCVLDLGMRGAAITHFIDDVDPLGPTSHAVYAEAARLGVPLWLHTGHNLDPLRRPDYCTWREIDSIARAHSDLTIIAGHGGWPWVLDLVSVCQRHPRVFLEFSSHRPAHMSRLGSGWEALLAHGSTSIRSKVLFGSMAWIHGLTERELAEEVLALEINERTAQAWLHDNATRLLKAHAEPLCARQESR